MYKLYRMTLFENGEKIFCTTTNAKNRGNALRNLSKILCEKVPDETKEYWLSLSPAYEGQGDIKLYN